MGNGEKQDIPFLEEAGQQKVQVADVTVFRSFCLIIRLRNIARSAFWTLNQPFSWLSGFMEYTPVALHTGQPSARW